MTYIPSPYTDNTKNKKPKWKTSIRSILTQDVINAEQKKNSYIIMAILSMDIGSVENVVSEGNK